MNGRGFYDWYVGELRKDNSPAFHQVPMSLDNNPGNSLGMPVPSPLRQKQNVIPNMNMDMVVQYLNQMGNPKEQQPNYSGNLYTGLPGLVNGAY